APLCAANNRLHLRGAGLLTRGPPGLLSPLDTLRDTVSRPRLDLAAAAVSGADWATTPSISARYAAESTLVLLRFPPKPSRLEWHALVNAMPHVGVKSAPLTRRVTHRTR